MRTLANSVEIDTDEAFGLADGRTLSSEEWLHNVITSSKLTATGEILARYIAANPRLASFASATELAGRVGVNTATVVRFAQRIGFAGWKDFQLNFRHRYYIGTLLPSDLLKARQGTDEESWHESAIHQDIANLQATLKTIRHDDVIAIARTMTRARRTLVLASGSYAAVGQVLAHLAGFMGYDVELETRGGASLVTSVSRLTTDDCVVVVSFWRLLRQEVLAAQYCKERNIPTCVITDSTFSPLVQTADLALSVPTEGIAFFQSITAAISVVYGILGELYVLGGADVIGAVERAQGLFAELDVLYT